MTVTTKLITIAFSHYCEKARWALERAGVAFDEDIHLPGFHYRAVKRAGGEKTVPVLVADGVTVRDSTDIVAWADTHRPGSMIPVAGSAYTYTYATLGEFFAWIIAWDLILEYGIAAATVSAGWSGYFNKMLEGFGMGLPTAWSSAPFTYDGHHIVSTGASASDGITAR